MNQASTTETELTAVRAMLHRIMEQFDILNALNNIPAPLLGMLRIDNPVTLLNRTIEEIPPAKAEQIIQACYDLVATIEGE